MKSNTFLHFVTGCMMILFVNFAEAKAIPEAEALKFAETKGKEILELFQEPDLSVRYKKLDTMILEYIDIDHISKFLMGKYWKTMTDNQKKSYKEIFTRYGLALYKSLPLEYAKNIKYKITGALKDGNYTNVSANIEFGSGDKKQNITVTFRLHETAKKIKIVDVKVAESSLLLSYRSKFYEMIAQLDGEIEWFLEDLGDKTFSMEESLKQNIITQQKYLEIKDKTI